MNDAVLITGGTGKIGSRLVEHFYSQGCTVVFTSRSDENIAKVVSGRERLVGVKVDFRDDAAVDVITAALDRLGVEVSALVNNARDLDALGVDEDGTVPGANWLAEYRIDVVLPYQLSIALAKRGGLSGCRRQPVRHQGQWRCHDLLAPGWRPIWRNGPYHLCPVLRLCELLHRQ